MLFSEVLVPQQVKTKLINTAKSNRVSHAQLFLCQEGMPGLALAWAYCQYLMCQYHDNHDDSCGECPSCKKVAGIAHADLHFIFPNGGKDSVCTKFYEEWRHIMHEKHAMFSLQEWADCIGERSLAINVRDIAYLISLMQSKPYEADGRYIIMWLPELMNETAANKLLKTLEEPDGKTVIIMVTENTDKILPTILSRAQLLKINKFPIHDYIRVVSEQVECTDDVAAEIGYMTNFNIQKAVTLGMNVVDTENFTRFVTMMRLAYALYNIPANKVDFTAVEKWVAQCDSLSKESTYAYFNYALTMVRKCMLINADSSSLIRSSQEEEKFLSAFSPFVHLGNGRQIMEVLDNAIKDMKVYNANQKMTFCDVLLQIGRLLVKKQ